MITLNNIKLNINQSENELVKMAQSKVKGKLRHFAILKKSLDARDKSALKWIYTIEFSDKDEIENIENLPQAKVQPNKVAIIGSGPAGLFCAIRLVDMGIRPIVIERGSKVEERARTIDYFYNNRVLDENTNIQFGEGGAGTFSDGKLNTQTNSPLNKEVLKTFVKFGAPEEILYLSKPHIGSDILRKVIVSMREYILKNGGEFLFNSRLVDINNVEKDEKQIVVENTISNEKQVINVSDLVLAIGHSSRDTFKMLEERGFFLEQKDFAVGVRVEHLQEKISFSQYGKNFALLPPADYKLVSHTSERSVFSFCMCPGGFVMGASSEKNSVVVNGMSNFARDNVNANSALIVQVKKEDFKSENALAGIEFQRKLERKAFELGGNNYNAPVQLVGDFLKNKSSTKFGEVKPSYPCGTTFAKMSDLLPNELVESLKLGIVDMDKRLRGFSNDDAVMTGVESRTSSPIRITRGEDYQSVRFKGVYPCGEGAGYAGGITSSAVDGLRVAQSIFDKYNA